MIRPDKSAKKEISLSTVGGIVLPYNFITNVYWPTGKL